MKTLLIFNFILFVLLTSQSAFASACSDSEYLEKREITLNSDTLKNLTITKSDLERAGYLAAGEKPIKINLIFDAAPGEGLKAEKSLKSREGFKTTYDYELLQNDNECVRLTSYFPGHIHEREVVSVKFTKAPRDIKIVSATLYVTKRHRKASPRNFSNLHEERVRMAGFCFPGACLEYISTTNDYSRFIIQNDSLDDLKTLQNGIFLKCYKGEFPNTDEEDIHTKVNIPNTKRKTLKRGESISFDNLCPANTKNIYVVSQIRGYDSSVALDGWISLWGQK